MNVGYPTAPVPIDLNVFFDLIIEVNENQNYFDYQNSSKYPPNVPVDQGHFHSYIAMVCILAKKCM